MQGRIDWALLRVLGWRLWQGILIKIRKKKQQVFFVKTLVLFFSKNTRCFYNFNWEKLSFSVISRSASISAKNQVFLLVIQIIQKNKIILMKNTHFFASFIKTWFFWFWFRNPSFSDFRNTRLSWTEIRKTLYFWIQKNEIRKTWYL